MSARRQHKRAMEFIDECIKETPFIKKSGNRTLDSWIVRIQMECFAKYGVCTSFGMEEKLRRTWEEAK